MSAGIQLGIRPGAVVQVVQKQDQRTGKLTRGIVKDILTKSSTHPHGIKVRLTSGVVGRVKRSSLRRPHIEFKMNTKTMGHRHGK